MAIGHSIHQEKVGGTIFPPMTTARLLLRRFLVEDITPGYVAALNDPEVVRFTEVRHQRWDTERTREYVRACNGPGQPLLIGMFRLDTKQHLGNLILHVTPVHQRVELAFMLWDRHQWNQGYATEAVSAVTEACFCVLGAHKVCAGYYGTHQSSARVLEKAGFVVEARLVDHCVSDGGYVDAIRVTKFQPANQAR